ncbi:hypothetical protein, partial [Sphingobacterium sp.]|uniref:GGDEF domain-containing protein n=1 Tax=Sphingobacterium sp. TaxID=341027 RepID=UPI0028998111
DEFAVILSGCTPRRAARIGGELLQTLSALSIPWDQHRLRVGASIGIASHLFYWGFLENDLQKFFSKASSTYDDHLLLF